MPPKKKPVNVTPRFVVETINEMKAEILDSINLEINKSIETLKSTIIENLVNENIRLSNKCNKLENEVYEFYDRFYDLESGLYELQQRSRRKNIEIAGLPNDILDENLESTVINILNNGTEEDNPLRKDEIDAIHRLPSRGDFKPVIIRFSGRKRRDEIIELNYTINDHDLAPYGIENKIYINDSLSPKMKTLHYHARQLRRQQKKFNDTKPLDPYEPSFCIWRRAICF